MSKRDRVRREERGRKRRIDDAAQGYFVAIHEKGHLDRYPDLDNAGFRAQLDLSCTGRDIAEEVGDALAIMAEECPDCSISCDGQLDEDEMYVKGTALAERASRRAKAEELAIDLGLGDDPRKKLAERLGGFIPGELRDDDDLMRNVKKT